MMPQCMITGVLLVNAESGHSVYGDLFRFGDAWIVNANVGPDDEYWIYRPLDDKRRSMRFDPQGPHFERRGVFVFSEGTGGWEFSIAALEYIEL